MEEFALLADQEVFKPLVPLLQQAETFISSEYGVVSLNISSRINGGNEWLRNVCDEYVLIMHLNEESENTIDIGCQQSERYTIKITNPSTNEITFLVIPFDKVAFFNGAERVEQYRKEPYFDYEVALSFAGEDRQYAGIVAKELRRKNIRVFYDEYEVVFLWGKDLYTHLDEVYQKRARFCVLFLSSNYKAKVWTNHERESAQARAFTEKRDYILPVRLDDTEIPGVRSTLGYIDGRKVKPKAVADLVQKKLLGFR